MERNVETTASKEPPFDLTYEEQTSNGINENDVDAQAQQGVQDIEAITINWGTKALAAAYILIWIIYFVEGLLSGTLAALSPYVTSDFVEQPLLPTVSVLAAIIGGVSNFTIAKILDVFGRPQGLLLCIFIAVIGLIMLAATNNVESYAAGQVFYTVGNNGLQYTLSVFVADTTSLKNRGLMQAFASSPYMITCWLAGPISSGFLYGAGWQWAFGMFTILVPAVTLPLFGLLVHNYVQAKKKQIVPARADSRPFLQALLSYLKEIDAVGLLLLSGGVAMFLLPFNLYTIQATGWSSPLILCLLVFGIVALIPFGIWERFLAPVTFIPWNLLKDRTVVGACLLSFTAFFSTACFSSYFSPFLQIFADLSVTDASYVVQVGTVVSVIASLVAGTYIHYTGRFKNILLYFGVPLNTLGTGLLIYFRQPNQYAGYLVMCQIFIFFGSGFVVVCDEIAILAATNHQYIAVAIATVSLSGSIGSAIGYTVAAAIYQGIFPNRLLDHLPADALDNLVLIYGDIVTQLSYDVGTPTRTAIQQAYADTQQDLTIAATAVWALWFSGCFSMARYQGL